MKRPVALIATFALVLCVAAATLQGVVLRRAHTSGAKDVYVLESTMDQIVSLDSVGMGEQQMTMKSTSTLSLITGKVDQNTGAADVEMVTSDFKVDLGDLGGLAGDPAANLPKEIRIAGVFDPRNRFTASPAKPGPDAMMMNLVSSAGTSTQFFELPEGPVKIGDSWEVVVPKNPATGGQEAKLKATLVAERAEQGTDVWVVALEGTIPVDLDMTEMLKANPEMAGGGMPAMKVVGSLDVKAEALLEKAGCRTVSVTSEIKSKATTEMVDMGMTMDMKGTTKSKMVLKRGG